MFLEIKKRRVHMGVVSSCAINIIILLILLIVFLTLRSSSDAHFNIKPHQRLIETESALSDNDTHILRYKPELMDDTTIENVFLFPNGSLYVKETESNILKFSPEITEYSIVATRGKVKRDYKLYINYEKILFFNTVEEKTNKELIYQYIGWFNKAILKQLSPDERIPRLKEKFGDSIGDKLFFNSDKNLTSEFDIKNDIAIDVSQNVYISSLISYSIEYYIQNVENDEYTKLETMTEYLYGRKDANIEFQGSIEGFEPVTHSGNVSRITLKKGSENILRQYFNRKIITVEFWYESELVCTLNTRYQGKIKLCDEVRDKASHIEETLHKSLYGIKDELGVFIADVESITFVKNTKLTLVFTALTSINLEIYQLNKDLSSYTKHQFSYKNAFAGYEFTLDSNFPNSVIKNIEGGFDKGALRGFVEVETAKTGEKTNKTVVPEEDGSSVIKIFYNREEYSIKYIANGGEFVIDPNLDANYAKAHFQVLVPKPNSACIRHSNPELVFGYWSENKDATPGNGLTEGFKFERPVESGYTLYAIWEPKVKTPYKVVHYVPRPNGTDYIIGREETKQEYNNSVVSATYISELLNNGYSSHSEPTLEKLTGVVESDGSLVLKLYYKRNSYKLNFSTPALCTQFSAIDVLYGWQLEDSVIPKKADVIYPRHEFLYWFDETDPEEKAITFATFEMPARNVTLKAKFKQNVFSVTVEHLKEKLDGEYELFISNTFDQPEGLYTVEVKTFTGFSQHSANIHEKYIDNDCTITMKYVRKTYTIQYDPNGGEFISSAFNPNNKNEFKSYKYQALSVDPTTINENYKPKLVGKNFVYWSRESNGPAFEFNKPVTESFKLYAIYAVKKFTIEFNLDGGLYNAQPNIDNQIVKYGERVLQPDSLLLTYEGHNFKHWSKIHGSNEKYIFTEPVTESFTLFAVWEIKKHTIHFDLTDGTLNDELTIPDQMIIDKHTAEEPIGEYKKYGHDFKHWSRTKNGSKFVFTTQIIESFTLYAVWEPRVYEITFDLQGGTLNGNATIPSVQIKYGHEVPKFDDYPEKPEYAFRFWSKSSDGSTGEYNFNETVKDSFTLYVVWVKIFNITFNFQNGSANKFIKVGQGSPIPVQPIPTYDGYTFKHWSLTADGEEYDLQTPVNSNLTLYAIWALNVYLRLDLQDIVDFRKDPKDPHEFTESGGVYTFKYTKGEKLIFPGYPTKGLMLFEYYKNAANGAHVHFGNSDFIQEDMLLTPVYTNVAPEKESYPMEMVTDTDIISQLNKRPHALIATAVSITGNTNLSRYEIKLRRLENKIYAEYKGKYFMYKKIEWTEVTFTSTGKTVKIPKQIVDSVPFSTPEKTNYNDSFMIQYYNRTAQAFAGEIDPKTFHININNNPYRYLTKEELNELFTGSATISSTLVKQIIKGFVITDFLKYKWEQDHASFPGFPLENANGDTYKTRFFVYTDRAQAWNMNFTAGTAALVNSPINNFYMLLLAKKV